MKQNKAIRPSADKTRLAILKAARKLFAQHGFAGTSISTIAKKAKINQSLIYHHFKNKELLWRQIKAESLREQFAISDIDNLFDTSNLNNFLHDFVNKRFEFYEKNPDIRRMIFWQRLEVNQDLYGYDTNNRTYFDIVRETIIKFQKNGEVRRELNPDFILIVLHTLFSNIPEDYNFILKLTKVEREQVKHQYTNFVIDSLLRILQC